MILYKKQQVFFFYLWQWLVLKKELIQLGNIQNRKACYSVLYVHLGLRGKKYIYMCVVLPEAKSPL